MRSERFWKTLAFLSVLLALLATVSVDPVRPFQEETAAIDHIRDIDEAQQLHLELHGVYAGRLEDLAQELSVSGGDLPPDLARLLCAYRYRLRLTPEGYQLNAEPTDYPDNGQRTFFLDQTGVIRNEWGSEPASAESMPLSD